MKKVFIITLILTLLSCNNSSEVEVKELPTNINTISGIKVIRLSEEVDHGLNRVIINDTLEVLIYRGVESVSMIRIK